MTFLTRRLFAFLTLAALAACTGSPGKVKDTGTPIGEFKLGHIIVVADNAQKVDPSKTVTEAEWEAALKQAIDRRFSGYSGDQFYHIAVSVAGYSVAIPGIPVVAAPKTVVVLEAWIWDDAKQAKINTEPKQLWVYESVGADTVVGTGLTKSKEEQVANIAHNAAKQIEEWMRDNPDWFAAKE